jgi:predicted HNH restriction endonuclease
MKESKVLRQHAQRLKNEAWYLKHYEQLDSTLLERQAAQVEEEAQWIEELEKNRELFDAYETAGDKRAGHALANIRYIRDDASERNAAAIQINRNLARIADTFDDEPYIEPLPALELLWNSRMAAGRGMRKDQ